MDIERLTDYFSRVRQQETPDLSAPDEWQQLLINTEFMVASGEKSLCSVAGLVLFGKNPNRFVPQAGITAAAFPGIEKDYVTANIIRGPLVGLFRPLGTGVEVLESGVIERALKFVEDHASDPEVLDGAIRIRRPHYPMDAVREAIVNAVAHRDYLLGATDVELSIYSDRLEVISPGRLPNGITPARMRAGCRASRNQLIKDTLQDYRYMEHMGLGVPRKIIKLMRERNGTEPDLIAEEESFIVRLWRSATKDT
jgi:ATP-dependent DNA helicase RecG